MYFMCWALFLISTLLTVALSIVYEVLKLLIFWPPAVFLCLMLGMNLRLFVLFPHFLTWVRKRLLLFLDEDQAQSSAYTTNLRLIVEELAEAVPAIAITLINELLKKAREQRSSTLSTEGWCASSLSTEPSSLSSSKLPPPPS